jgi:hypothetical protein
MPDGSIVLMGGLDNSLGNYKNDTWRSTDNGATWTQLTANAGWSGRGMQSSVVTPDGDIVLMGGYAGTEKSDVWLSTDNGATWTQQTANAGWSARNGQSTVALADGSIVLMGGVVSNVPLKNDVWRSMDKGKTWTQQTASAGWSGRVVHSSVVMPDGSIVLMGGFDGTDILNDVWRSTDNGVTWTQLPNGGWSAREYFCSVAMPDGSIVMMGGHDAITFFSPKNDVWRLKPTGSSAKNPSHTFSVPGIYNVTLQVFNGGGYDSTRKIGYITVTDSSGVGSLEIKSSPSHAEIYINGIDTGKFAKWTFDDMTPGDYDVYVMLDGYTIPATEKITVVSGKTASLHFMLDKVKKVK